MRKLCKKLFASNVKTEKFSELDSKKKRWIFTKKLYMKPLSPVLHTISFFKMNSCILF